MADGYLDFLTAGAGSIDTPDAAAFDITGDIDLRYDLDTLDGVADTQVMISKVQTTGNQRSWWFTTAGTDPNETLKFSYSTDGITLNDQASTVHSLTGRYQVRVTVDVDNGASQHVITFYKRASGALTDNTGWTQISQHTNAGTISMFSGTSPVLINAYRSTGGTGYHNEFIHKAYQACIMDGIDGTVVAYLDFRSGDWSDLDTGHNDAQGNTWIARGVENTDWRYVAATGVVPSVSVTITAA